MNEACSYDFGDCEFEYQCAQTGCTISYLRDYECEGECNNSACDYDKGDCEDSSDNDNSTSIEYVSIIVPIVVGVVFIGLFIALLVRRARLRAIKIQKEQMKRIAQPGLVLVPPPSGSVMPPPAPIIPPIMYPSNQPQGMYGEPVYNPQGMPLPMGQISVPGPLGQPAYMQPIQGPAMMGSYPNSFAQPVYMGPPPPMMVGQPHIAQNTYMMLSTGDMNANMGQGQSYINDSTSNVPPHGDYTTNTSTLNLTSEAEVPHSK